MIPPTTSRHSRSTTSSSRFAPPAASPGPSPTSFDVFWVRYLDASGDRGLAEAIAPHFAFRALVLGNPLWYPRETEPTRRLLFRFLLSVLEATQFQVEEIPAYLERASP